MRSLRSSKCNVSIVSVRIKVRYVTIRNTLCALGTVNVTIFQHQLESFFLNMEMLPVCYQASKQNLWTFNIEFKLSYAVLVQKIQEGPIYKCESEWCPSLLFTVQSLWASGVMNFAS